MASSSELPPVPSAAKFIQPLIARAIELGAHDPVMSYYCKLHAVQQILAKNLHLEDGEVEKFATTLLDNIEELKNSADENTASIIDDDVTAQAYVENFALRIFVKADNEIRVKKTTKTTATTFMAAATFLDILKVFQSPLDQDIANKIKYSKYHAARIIKAYKAGEDPNDYDVPEDEEGEEEDDGELFGEPTEISANQPAPQEDEGTAPPEPLDLSPDSLNLPSAPPVLPSAPPGIPAGPTFPSAPVSFSSGSSAVFPTAPVSRPNVPQPPTPQPPAPSPSIVSPVRPSHPTNNVTHSPSLSKADVQTILDQTEIISSAQKHAKFAISALNYDDISTAVKELKAALNLLERQS